jgi:hypothetical protein
MIRKLGKLPAIQDSRNLKLAAYLDLPKLPPLPATDDNYAKLSRMTMANNDLYGCCVVSGAAHIIQVWSSMAAREVILPDKTVLDTYLKLTGGQDTGLSVLAFLNWWRKNPVAGHPLGAFVEIDPTDPVDMKYGIYLFGGIYTGLCLPKSAQKQKVWDVPRGGPVGDGEANSWGGHLTVCGAYDKQGRYVNYTWGEKKAMTPAFTGAYCDEAYALLSLDWFKKDHKSPDGFAWRDLVADLKVVAS